MGVGVGVLGRRRGVALVVLVVLMMVLVDGLHLRRGGKKYLHYFLL